MEWTKLNFSKNQVNKAGDILISSSSSQEEYASPYYLDSKLVFLR